AWTQKLAGSPVGLFSVGTENAPGSTGALMVPPLNVERHSKPVRQSPSFEQRCWHQRRSVDSGAQWPVKSALVDIGSSMQRSSARAHGCVGPQRSASSVNGVKKRTHGSLSGHVLMSQPSMVQ